MAHPVERSIRPKGHRAISIYRRYRFGLMGPISVVLMRRMKVTAIYSTENKSVTEGPLSGATYPRFFKQKYAVYWPEGGEASQYSAFIGQKMSLTG